MRNYGTNFRFSRNNGNIECALHLKLPVVSLAEQAGLSLTCLSTHEDRCSLDVSQLFNLLFLLHI